MRPSRFQDLAVSPLGPLGILVAPLFEKALDNSQQFRLGWGFTLGKETVDIKASA